MLAPEMNKSSSILDVALLNEISPDKDISSLEATISEL
jgi:hypothetical protein